MEEQKNFKERWNSVDETCPQCGKVTKRARGLTKQNLKRLITPQWNMQEVIITFMLIMVLVLAYTYQSETKQCRDWINSMAGEDCESACRYNCQRIVVVNQSSALSLPNASELNMLLNITLLP